MCLGVPGKVVEVGEEKSGLLMGRVDFGGLVKEICLAYTPEVQVGEYVLVHVGFALSRIDEAQAQELFQYLAEMDALNELAVTEAGAQPPSSPPTPGRSE